jgi:hypothetical protein
MTHAMYYRYPCNRRTQHLITTKLCRQYAVRPFQSSLVFSLPCCRFVPYLSRCYTTRQRLPHDTERQQMNKTKILPLLCFKCICPFCMRFEFSGIFSGMSIVLFYGFSQFLHANVCVLLCINFSFLFLQVSRNMAIKIRDKDTPKIVEQESL